MSRIFLIFAAALVALMAGALFYAARLPFEPGPLPPPASAESEQVTRAAEVPVIELVQYPAFSLPDLNGNERQLTDWDGKNRILNFWATWCAPCRREIPVLKAFQDEQSGNGFQVIGIAVDFPEEVQRFAEKIGFNYPVLVGQEDAMAVAETSGIQFMALPFTMFIASDGEYLSAYMGELHAEQLANIVETMTRLDRHEITADEARTQLASL
jgi:thiol-disulfide isomerase/thioredoxin